MKIKPKKEEIEKLEEFIWSIYKKDGIHGVISFCAETLAFQFALNKTYMKIYDELKKHMKDFQKTNDRKES